MTGSAFTDRTAPPDDADLAAVLGRSKTHWDAILAHVDGLEGVAPEWKHYAGKHGWQLKLMAKRRALLWLVPHAKSFLAGMALRESALDALHEAGLPPELVESIENEKTVMEGRPARVEVRTKKDRLAVLALLALKREH